MDTSCFTCAWFTLTDKKSPLRHDNKSIGACRRWPPGPPSYEYHSDGSSSAVFCDCFEPIWEETAIGCGEWKCHPDLVAKRMSDFANSFQAADTSSPK